MAFAICRAVAVRAAGSDDAAVRACRTAGCGDDAASTKTVSVAITFTGSGDDAVTGAFAVRNALTGVSVRLAAAGHYAAVGTAVLPAGGRHVLPLDVVVAALAKLWFALFMPEITGPSLKPSFWAICPQPMF